MLEIWFEQAKKGVARHGGKPFGWMRIFRPEIWIVMAVVALVFGRLWWVKASRPAHRAEIAAAFGWAGEFYGLPQMDHGGNRVTYVATDDHGYALFLRDVSAGRKQIMVKQEGFGDWGDSLDITAGPWSPDDSSFLYSARGNLYLCPLDTNVAPAKLDIESKMALADIVWVNPQEFAWLDNQTICYARKSAEGRWVAHELPHRGRIMSLTAIDDRNIAWLEGNYICRVDLTAHLEGANNPFSVPVNADAGTTPMTNNVALWLDASTLRQANQTSVAMLADLSPNKNHAVINQKAPTFNAADSPGALNHQGTIHFASGHAANDAMGLRTARPLGLASFQPRSVFAVMRRDPGRSQMLISVGSTQPDGGCFGLVDQRDSLYLPSGSSASANGGRKSPLPDSWHVLEMIYDGTNGSGYVNGGFLGSVTLPPMAADTETEIGLCAAAAPARTNGAASDGDFAELLIYDHALNTGEQRQVEEYLSDKWFGNHQPLSAKRSFVWFDPGMEGLTGFQYSKERRQFLLSRTENGRDSWWRLDARPGAASTPSLVLQDRSLEEVQDVETGGFDGVARETGHAGLLQIDATGKQTARLLEHENIPWFQVAPNGKKMLFFGNVSNSPSLGIWEYDFGSRQVQPAVPWSDHATVYAKNITPLSTEFRLPSGRYVHCTIFPPANFDPHKKYPLLLGNTLLGVQVMGSPSLNATVRGAHGRLWVQCLANCGAFVVIVNRDTWWGGIEQWEENVRGVHQILVRDPCIDGNQVFLFAASAETPYLNDCLAKSPGSWRGAIYLSPTALPNFSEAPPFQSRPKILISIGGAENREEQIRGNQSYNLAFGGSEEFVIHPGEQHRVYGNAGQSERTRAMMHFIFEE